MGVEKIILERGNGTDAPVKHDEVSLSYTGSTNITHPQNQGSWRAGWLYSDDAPNKKGKQ